MKLFSFPISGETEEESSFSASEGVEEEEELSGKWRRRIERRKRKRRGEGGGKRTARGARRKRKEEEEDPAQGREEENSQCGGPVTLSLSHTPSPQFPRSFSFSRSPLFVLSSCWGHLIMLAVPQRDRVVTA